LAQPAKVEYRVTLLLGINADGSIVVVKYDLGKRVTFREFERRKSHLIKGNAVFVLQQLGILFK
jgi:hypothetical protein